MKLSPKKFTILCVDDDVDDQQLIADSIHEVDKEVQVTCVNNGEEALHFLAKAKQQQLPSLVLLDINMPMLNGKATLVKMKEDPQLSKIPVVMFTTSSDRKDKDFCLRHGAATFITKPINQAELQKIVEAIRRMIKP